ncbi:MAG: hypothetical protein ACOC3F_03545 [Desulfosudaceae bacterium]
MACSFLLFVDIVEKLLMSAFAASVTAVQAENITGYRLSNPGETIILKNKAVATQVKGAGSIFSHNQGIFEKKNQAGNKHGRLWLMTN